MGKPSYILGQATPFRRVCEENEDKSGSTAVMEAP